MDGDVGVNCVSLADSRADIFAWIGGWGLPPVILSKHCEARLRDFDLDARQSLSGEQLVRWIVGPQGGSLGGGGFADSDGDRNRQTSGDAK